MFLCIDFCVVAVKTSMGLVRSRTRLTEIRLVSNFLLKLLCFPWLLEISCTIPKRTLSKVSFFHHFRCEFVSFFSVVNVPTTTVPILMSTLARRRRCARIFSKGSVDEDSRYVCSYCSLFSCSLLSFLFAFELELHLTPEKITEAFRLLTYIVDSQILEMHTCVSMLS